VFGTQRSEAKNPIFLPTYGLISKHLIVKAGRATQCVGCRTAFLVFRNNLRKQYRGGLYIVFRENGTTKRIATGSPDPVVAARFLDAWMKARGRKKFSPEVRRWLRK